MTVDYSRAVKLHRFDLLTVDGQLVPLIETVRRDDWLLIENVVVPPAFQQRGYGVRLLGLAEDLAAANGRAGTRLYTNKLFAENLRLYASLGYQLEREDALNGGVAVRMVEPRGVAPQGS